MTSVRELGRSIAQDIETALEDFEANLNMVMTPVWEERGRSEEDMIEFRVNELACFGKGLDSSPLGYEGKGDDTALSPIQPSPIEQVVITLRHSPADISEKHTSELEVTASAMRDLATEDEKVANLSPGEYPVIAFLDDVTPNDKANFGGIIKNYNEADIAYAQALKDAENGHPCTQLADQLEAALYRIRNEIIPQIGIRRK